MACPENESKSEKTWTRNARFVLYAVILVASLLWLRHDMVEKGKRDAARAAAYEASLKLQREADIRNQRIKALSALVHSVAAAEDPQEKIRIYDEIIETYRDDKTIFMQRCVSWALLRKGKIVADPSEKSRLFRTVIDGYCEMADENMNSYVMSAVNEMLRHINSRAEKIAFYDDILEKYGRRLPDSLAARLMFNKTKLIRNTAETIALYDAILSRFLFSDDDSAYGFAIDAAAYKLELVTDETEQRRLCDIIIDAFMKATPKIPYYRFEQAIAKKARIVGDPSLPLRLWDQVIANNVTEESVIQARTLRMELLNEDNECLAAYDEIIANHQNSKSDYVRLMVVRAMRNKASLLTDTEEAEGLLRSVIEGCAEITDTRALYEANQAVAMLAKLNDDPAIAIRYYDEVAAKTENRLEAVEALESKALVIKEPAGRIRIYDEIIARIGDSSDIKESRQAIYAISRKIDLIKNKQEKIRLYDQIIARAKNFDDYQQQKSAAEAMLKKGMLLDGKEQQIALYDEIIIKGMNNGDEAWLGSAVRAVQEKAKLIDDKEEKIRLYDAILFDMGRFSNRYSCLDAFKARLDLAPDSTEKVRLYERYMAALGSSIDPCVQVSLLLEKAAIINNPVHQSRVYDEVIKLCERYLHTVEIAATPIQKYHNRHVLLDDLGHAILARADLSGNAEEKVKLYDTYLAYPQMNPYYLLDPCLKKILYKKSLLCGCPSTKIDYYNEHIQAAATDHERVYWYVQKTRAVGMAKRIAIEGEMIDKFFDSPEKDIERVIAKMVLRKIGRTYCSSKRVRMCNRLIERYRDSTDNHVLYAIVHAFATKAEAAEDEETKLEIYNTVIERYAGVKSFLVKSDLDKIIVEKSRLEATRMIRHCRLLPLLWVDFLVHSHG